MMGDDDADDLSEGSFNSKSVWARMSVVAAGPIFNLILACVFCFILIMITGYRSPEITGVLDGYSAQEVDYKPETLSQRSTGGTCIYGMMSVCIQ